MAGPHCLVYEPDVTGHRLQHVRHLTEALLDIGCTATIALQADCRERTEYHVHLRALKRRFRLLAGLDLPRGPSIASHHGRIGELIATIAATKPDWVYVPYADGFTQIAALESLLYGGGIFKRVPIEAQIMRGKYGYPPRSPVDALDAAANRWLTRRSPWRVTHVLDPFALRALEPLPKKNAIRLIPEPVEPLPQLDRREARQALGVPSDGRYLAFVGGVDPRKGIELFVSAFARAKLADHDRLLFVGRVAAPIREWLYREHDQLLRQGRIVLVDRYVSDHELDCGFIAGDVVAVTHPRQIGSSGTLVRAAAARRPVLASDFGWVAWVTRTFQFGTVVNVSDVDQYAQAITTALASSADYRIGEAAVRFCQFHTIANQKAHWVAEIAADRGLSLGALAKRIDWQWVLDAVDEKKAA